MRKQFLSRCRPRLALLGVLFLALAAFEHLAQAEELSALTLASTQVTGGNPLKGTVRLTGPERGRLFIGLSSNNKALAAVPMSIQIEPGATSAEFSITTSPVEEGPKPVSVVITASQKMKDGRTVTKSSTLTVLPPVLKEVGIVEVMDAIHRPVCKSNAARAGGVSTYGCVILTGPAPSVKFDPSHPFHGIVVKLSSNNTAVGVPEAVTIPAGKTEQTFTISTHPVAASISAVISAQSNPSDTKQATLSVTPPALSSLVCNPNSVTGGNPAPCTVGLTGPAYVPGVRVALSSNNAIAKVPDHVMVVAERTVAGFTVTTIPVVNSTSVTITASFGGATKQATVTVIPPVLNSFGCNPTKVTGGDPVSCTVSLTGKVASGSVANVPLSSDNPAATVPASVPVPAGEDSASVTAQTNKVTGKTNATLTASYGGVSKPVTLTIATPPMPDLAIRTEIYYDASGNGISNPQAGQAFQMCINVVNIGQAKAGSSTLRVDLYQSGFPQAQKIKTWDKGTPALNPGAGSAPDDPCIDVPALSAGYTYDFNIYVDANNDVAESSENNNYGHVGLNF
jgi:hypothetical protein